MADEEKKEEMGKEVQFSESAAEAIRQAGALTSVKGMIIIPPKGPADLKPDAKILNKVLQMDGEKVARELPAEHQLIADAWNEADVEMPYLVYMPEKDRLLLLYNIYFCEGLEQVFPVLSFSDDHGKTWSKPNYLRDMGFCPEGTPEARTYIGNGTALSYLGNGKLILATGEQLTERKRGFSSDYGETWSTRPLPKSSPGFPWSAWDPMLVDKDPVTGELKRLCEAGYSGGMERAFAGAKKIFVFPDELYWRYDPEDRGLAEEWYKEASFDKWPHLMRIDKYWTQQGEPGGIGWYAKSFEMPETGSAPLVILFGAVDGYCDVFIDGKKIGEQKVPPGVAWRAPFHIPLDGGLSAGMHKMVIRVEKKCERQSNAGIHLPIWIVKPDSDIPAVDETSLLNGRHANLRAYIRFSYDGGLTWPEEIEPPSWNGSSGVSVSEVALVRAGNGTIIASGRIRYPKYMGQTFLDQYSGLGVSLSKDNGYTWTKIEPLYEFGRMHPSMVLMPNGDIVMTYVVRMGWLSKEDVLLDEDGYPQWSIEAVVSRDNGESWDLSHKYILAKWSGSKDGVNSATLTSTLLLPDGSLLTAFSSGYLSHRSVKGAGGGHEVGLAGGGHEVGLVRWCP